jgi:hypothetical protein
VLPTQRENFGHAQAGTHCNNLKFFPERKVNRLVDEPVPGQPEVLSNPRL